MIEIIFVISFFIAVYLIFDRVIYKRRYEKILKGTSNVLKNRVSIDYSKKYSSKELEERFKSNFLKNDYSSAGVFLGYIKNFELLESYIKESFDCGDRESYEFAVLMIKHLKREPTLEEYQLLIQYDLENGYPVHAILRARSSGIKIADNDIESALQIAMSDFKNHVDFYRNDLKLLDDDKIKAGTTFYLCGLGGSENYFLSFLLLLKLKKWKYCRELINSYEYGRVEWIEDLFQLYGESFFRRDLREYLSDRFMPFQKKAPYLRFR